MIAGLRGNITHKTQEYIIIDVQGVGYQVWVNPRTLGQLAEYSEEVHVFTCLLYKEDRPVLYGFLNLREYDVFRLLTTVSGVGPKGALAVLDLAPAVEVEQAIAQENIKLLSSVSGIGKRTAERITLELKEKVAAQQNLSSETSDVQIAQSGSQQSELTEALEALGYKPQQIQEAVKHIDVSEGGLQDHVKQALQVLKRNKHI